jgi:molybdopterin-containing oxidoreductase family iron-sulfur binding subunit
MNNDYGRMGLNPDVVVRERGVMEKCSMCIQRIQEGRLDSKKSGKNLEDGQIKMACEQSCPAGAIVFGDRNDPNSRISKLFNNERKYHVIEEIKTLPSVAYLTKVRNKS